MSYPYPGPDGPPFTSGAGRPDATAPYGPTDQPPYPQSYPPPSTGAEYPSPPGGPDDGRPTQITSAPPVAEQAPTSPYGPAAPTGGGTTAAYPAYQPAGGYIPGAAPVGGPLPGAPSSALPYSPVSAPGYPVSGYPAAPPPRRSPAVLILALVAVLFFVTTAVFVPLYLAKSSDYTKKTAAARHQAQVDQARIADLRQKLKDETDKYDELHQKQSGTQNQLDEITKEKQIISQCIELQGEAVDAYLRGDTATYKAKSAQAKPVCDEAQKYLD